ncbi:MAG: RelA/SpoT domain-containing protein [Weeksellaceae bacterium]|nr:RelA/SpoT domain-containing protein [Weeksellaceae bacterium]
MTNGEIERLGERITSSDKILTEDIELLQEFRKSFKDPLSNTFDVLRTLTMKVDKKAIVTCRIKRIDTIIRKLKRFKNNPSGRMPLHKMWDIAGCRCIFDSNDVSQIYRLKDLLIKHYGECKIKDYVKVQKKDGYQSLHIYVQDKISNKKIEIQIRITRQHNWATLVEILDLIFNTKIKEGEKNLELQRFLFLFSKRDTLSVEENLELIKFERQYNIFRKMSDIFSKNYIRIRRQWISQKKDGSFYVIEANKDLSSTIDSFKDFESAENQYYQKYTSNSDSNIVLTYIKNAEYKQISKAYSNYVLTMHSFFEDYKKILEDQIIEQLNARKFFKVWRSLSRYRKTTAIYLRNIRNEIKELNVCHKDSSIKSIHKNEWKKDLSKEITIWQESTKLFFSRQSGAINKGDIYDFLIEMQYRLLAIQIK